MSGGSTTIKGAEISDKCMRYAGMLNLDIYDTPKNHVAPELAKQYALNKRYWEKLWEIKKADGFRCAFYAPRDAAKKDRNSVCPPALVFRGSDSEPEDFAELAASVRLNGTYFVDVPMGGGGDISGPFAVDRTFSAAAAYAGKTMAQMNASGLRKQSLFTRAVGRTQYSIDGPMLFNVDIDLNWTLDATLYYGQNGDWAVNFAQGLGRTTPQYTEAIKAGKRAAADATANWNNRLIITGHSLGGGLASAAAIAARIVKPELRIRCTTYNAAGLHANTARQAGGTLSTAANVPIRAVHVKDEILNSMQARSRMVPFLADLLAWGGQSMPPAVANPSASTGVSPGPMPITQNTYSPKMKPLPVLFTLDRQALGPRVAVLGDILALANNARTVQVFVNNTITMLLNRVLNNGNASFADLKELPTLGGALALPPDFQTLLMNAVMKGAPVPPLTIRGTGNVANRLRPLANALLQDAVTLARVMIASGEYHTFPPCAFTFLLEPK
ncbi:MAG: hypothetical protein JNN06_07275 [Gemmobacter sp.]|uniref:lipase family protein n=1 Tax=Gemmobacter sp. TaxID=1898957 RepID=UPI001A4E45F7|nr:hypothetical protein [Gemmobacter sp.]MBL8562067.1 hypothetical protein [Gemmobacter sp.]